MTTEPTKPAVVGPLDGVVSHLMGETRQPLRDSGVHDQYRPMVPQPAEPAHRCPLCGSPAQVWEFSEKPDDIVTRVVMCDRGDDVLYMPPNDFYQGTGRDAVRYWNAYAEACEQARELPSSYPPSRATGG
jgi:hypothetical protein